MKKTVYTLAFMAVFAIAGKAQVAPERSQYDKSDNAAQAKSNNTQSNTDQKTDNTKTEKSSQAGQDPKSGTRMAITEKGMPAPKAKAKTENKTEENKENK